MPPAWATMPVSRSALQSRGREARNFVAAFHRVEPIRGSTGQREIVSSFGHEERVPSGDRATPNGIFFRPAGPPNAVPSHATAEGGKRAVLRLVGHVPCPLRYSPPALRRKNQAQAAAASKRRIAESVSSSGNLVDMEAHGGPSEGSRGGFPRE